MVKNDDWLNEIEPYTPNTQPPSRVNPDLPTEVRKNFENIESRGTARFFVEAFEALSVKIPESVHAALPADINTDIDYLPTLGNGTLYFTPREQVIAIHDEFATVLSSSSKAVIVKLVQPEQLEEVMKRANVRVAHADNEILR